MRVEGKYLIFKPSDPKYQSDNKSGESKIKPEEYRIELTTMAADFAHLVINFKGNPNDIAVGQNARDWMKQFRGEDEEGTVYHQVEKIREMIKAWAKVITFKNPKISEAVLNGELVLFNSEVHHGIQVHESFAEKVELTETMEFWRMRLADSFGNTLTLSPREAQLMLYFIKMRKDSFYQFYTNQELTEATVFQSELTEVISLLNASMQGFF